MSHFETNVGFVSQLLQKLIVVLPCSLLLILLSFLFSECLDFLALLSLFLLLLFDELIVLLLGLSELSFLSLLGVFDVLLELVLLFLLGNELAEDSLLAVMLRDSGTHGLVGSDEHGSDQQRYNE